MFILRDLLHKNICKRMLTYILHVLYSFEKFNSIPRKTASEKIVDPKLSYKTHFNFRNILLELKNS